MLETTTRKELRPAPTSCSPSPLSWPPRWHGWRATPCSCSMSRRSLPWCSCRWCARWSGGTFAAGARAKPHRSPSCCWSWSRRSPGSAFLPFLPWPTTWNSSARRRPIFRRSIGKLHSIPYLDRLDYQELSTRVEGWVSHAAAYIMVSVKDWAGRIADLLTCLVLTIYFILEGDIAYCVVSLFRAAAASRAP